MNELLVLGMGNRLMMDDGIGVYAVETLKEKSTDPGIWYVIGETDVYFCLDQIKNASRTIIVDAAFFGKEPGTIGVFPLEQILINTVCPIFIHNSNLLNEIKMSGKSIEGMFIGIEAHEINYGTSLSPVLQSRYFTIIGEIEDLIEDYHYNQAKAKAGNFQE